MGTKKIPLTRGKVAIVDSTDFVFLNQWKWTCSAKGYAMRHATYNGKSVCVYMHKVLLGYFGAGHGDHKNRNTLDNRKSNLRIATKHQNARNKSVYQNNTLGVRGVRTCTDGKTYSARIKAGKKEKHLGTFKTLKEAKEAYNKAAIKLFGEWACLNK